MFDGSKAVGTGGFWLGVTGATGFASPASARKFAADMVRNGCPCAPPARNESITVVFAVVSCCKKVHLCGSQSLDVEECVVFADVHSGTCWLSPRHVGPVHCEVWPYFSPPEVVLVLAGWGVPAIDRVLEDP